jgi:hypothetical protein
MKYYWTTKDGTKIDVDDMSTEHLRNTLKMILRNIDNAKSKPKSLGNIEACFQEEEIEEEYNELEEEYNEWYRTHELGNCDATEIDIY